MPQKKTTKKASTSVRKKTSRPKVAPNPQYQPQEAYQPPQRLQPTPQPAPNPIQISVTSTPTSPTPILPTPLTSQPNMPPRASALCYDSEKDRRLVETSLSKLLLIIFIPVIILVGYILIVYSIDRTTAFSQFNLIIMLILASIGLVIVIVIVAIDYSSHRSIPLCKEV